MNDKTLVKVNLDGDVVSSFLVDGYTAGCGHTTSILGAIYNKLPKLRYFSRLVETLDLTSEEYKSVLVFNFISERGF